MAYAENPAGARVLSRDVIFVEGDAARSSWRPDYWVRLTTPKGRTLAPLSADDVTPGAIRPTPSCSRASSLATRTCFPACAGNPKVETTGEDNLAAMRLVFKSYESAARMKL